MHAASDREEVDRWPGEEHSTVLLSKKGEKKKRAVTPTWRRKLQQFVSHTYFEWFVYFCILYNTVVMALDDIEVEWHGRTWAKELDNLSDTVVLAIFTIEAIMKMIAFGIAYKVQEEESTQLGNTDDLSEDELKAVRDAFDLFDTDGGGTIDEFELRIAMRALGLSTNEHEVRKMFEEVDVDGSGQLEYEEFVKMMMAKMSQRREPDGYFGGLCHRRGLLGRPSLPASSRRREPGGRALRPRPPPRSSPARSSIIRRPDGRVESDTNVCESHAEPSVSVLFHPRRLRDPRDQPLRPRWSAARQVCGCRRQLPRRKLGCEPDGKALFCRGAAGPFCIVTCRFQVRHALCRGPCNQSSDAQSTVMRCAQAGEPARDSSKTKSHPHASDDGLLARCAGRFR
eukprot:1006072-Rhodomonas_salina.3